MAETDEKVSSETAEAGQPGAQKVALLDDHGVQIEVDAEHVHVLEHLGWVRAEATEPDEGAGEDEKQEEPPKQRGRRGGS